MMLRLASCFCAAALLAIPVSAAASDVASGLHQVDEWSSASKPKRKRAVTIYPDSYPPYRFGWRAADPSQQSEQRAMVPVKPAGGLRDWWFTLSSKATA